MTRVFNNIEEMKRYYNEETDTYRFKEDEKFIDEIIINFDLNVESNIEAQNVRATSITAKNIHARDIMVWEINARDINAVLINAGMIKARDIHTSVYIHAMDIYARDIKAFGIFAVNIYARDIVYNAACRTYEDLKCNSIKCRRPNPIQFSIYGKIEVIQNDK